MRAIMQDKKAQSKFTVPSFLIALASISVMFGMYFLYVTDMANDYDRNDLIDPEFNESYNRFTEDFDDLNSMFSEVQSDDGLTFIGAAGTLMSSAWNILRIVFTAPVRFHEMILAMGSDFGVPGAVSNLALIFMYFGILIGIVFAVVNYLSRGGKPL